MSKISIKHARLRDTFFIAGVNFQDKLDIDKRPELSLIYDREERELLVFFKQEMAIVPREYVAYMHPEQTGKVLPVKPVTAPPPGKIKAQVSTPQDHVFKQP